MASVPNMRIVPPPAAPGAAAPIEGEGGDLFASLLSIAPAGETILDGPAAPEGGAAPGFEARLGPATVDDAPESDAEGAAADKTTDGEAESDAVILAAAPVADFIPILQAQSAYPVVTAAVPPSPAPTEAAPSATPAALVPQSPVPSAAPAVAAEGDSAPGDRPTPSPTPAQAASVTDKDAPALPEPVKAALKAAVNKAEAKAPAPAPAPASAPARPETEIVEARTEPAADPAPAKASAPPPVATVNAPAQPVQAPIAALTDPAMSVAPAARASAPVPQPVDQAIERELDLAHESEWLDRLARDIVRSGASDGPMRFKLHPQTLGHLRVELTQGDQGASVRLTVETEAARAIIADAQPRLMQEARAQGVRIAHAEVDLAGTGHQASGDPRRQDDARQPVFIRTARGAGLDAAPAAEPGRARSDRYA